MYNFMSLLLKFMGCEPEPVRYLPFLFWFCVLIMSAAGKHTIILIQYSNAYQSRSYIDFPTIGAAMDALVKMYELKLKELNPSIQHISYDIADFNKYLDNIHDICGLVFDASTNKYDPKDRTWIKNKVFLHLSSSSK